MNHHANHHTFIRYSLTFNQKQSVETSLSEREELHQERKAHIGKEGEEPALCLSNNHA